MPFLRKHHLSFQLYQVIIIDQILCSEYINFFFPSRNSTEESAAPQHLPAILSPPRGKGRVPADDDEPGTFDIPIFTEEFLDHNKGCQFLFSPFKF